MTLKILGLGMPRTGTASLCEALRILGYNAIHHAPERIDLDTVNDETFIGLYDDVDAVLDMPAAYFANEISSERYILTVRDTDQWWESIKHHTNKIRTSSNIAHVRYTDRLHQLVFGTAEPHEFLWRIAYDRWYSKLGPLTRGSGNGLVMDITDGDGWEKLCTFIDKPIPDQPFPWKNKKAPP